MERKVKQIDRKSSTIIKIWDSVGEAAEELGIRKTGIYNCIAGRLKTTGGYSWEYVSLQPQETTQNHNIKETPYLSDIFRVTQKSYYKKEDMKSGDPFCDRPFPDWLLEVANHIGEKIRTRATSVTYILVGIGCTCEDYYYILKDLETGKNRYHTCVDGIEYLPTVLETGKSLYM